MNFLAFDIEAANGYKLYSICSIGVVEADENFNVVRRENIWINPKTKYNLNGTRKNVGIDLHLDKQLLEQSPDFGEIYGKISSILTRPDVIVLGHAVDSDVRMLNAACAKYKLPSIDFNFVCSQLLYKLYKGEKEVKALNKIATELGLDYNQHNSEDDAWMSLMTLKYVVESSGLTLEQLLNKYKVRIGSNKNFEIVRPVSLAGQDGVDKKLTQKTLARLKEYATKIKVVGNKLKGKTVAVDRSLELTDESVAKQIIATIVSQGGKYSTKLRNCNIYVVAEEQTPQDLMRMRRVNELYAQGLCEQYTLKQLLALSGEQQ